MLHQLQDGEQLGSIEEVFTLSAGQLRFFASFFN